VHTHFRADTNPPTERGNRVCQIAQKRSRCPWSSRCLRGMACGIVVRVRPVAVKTLKNLLDQQSGTATFSVVEGKRALVRAHPCLGHVERQQNVDAILAILDLHPCQLRRGDYTHSPARPAFRDHGPRSRSAKLQSRHVGPDRAHVVLVTSIGDADHSVPAYKSAKTIVQEGKISLRFVAAVRHEA
jgi:hypothetical protein